MDEENKQQKNVSYGIKSYATNTSGIEKTAKDGKVPNVGAGPITSDLMRTATWRSKAKYREHTGKDTEMGGATGGTPGVGDASEGNDNTGSAGQPWRSIFQRGFINTK